MYYLLSGLLHVFHNTEKKNRLERTEGRRKKKPREGCEGQDEVKKDTVGKPVKGIYTLLLSRLKDSQGGRLTSTQSMQRQRNKAKYAIKSEDGKSEGEIFGWLKRPL